MLGIQKLAKIRFGNTIGETIELQTKLNEENRITTHLIDPFYQLHSNQESLAKTDLLFMNFDPSLNYGLRYY